MEKPFADLVWVMSTSEIAIRVEALGKEYRIGKKQERYSTLRDSLSDAMLAPFRRAGRLLTRQADGAIGPKEIIWALKDISFQVKHGEAVGIIGRNGAGKSTLLKILSRITEPTAGIAEIHGRVGSLLEVGTGFHAELTGRENIYLNGAILGMRKAEIDRKFDEIVAFSEVEEFIDTPVKHYSTGMSLRLAFGVAAHLEPEILLVDEVLAVGDAGFQKKCLGKMGDVAKQGRTVLLVSHNMGAITQLCERAIWIESGQLRLTGSPPDLVAAYLLTGTESHSIWIHSSDCRADVKAQLKSVSVLSSDNQPTAVVDFDKPFNVEVIYEVVDPTRNFSILCRVNDLQGNVIWTSRDTDTTEWKGRVRERGRYASRCQVHGGLLRPGRYLISVGSYLGDAKMRCYHESVLGFDVSPVGCPLNLLDRMGVITPLFEWAVEPANGLDRTV
jgi:lipopolysaccharide transport system ATP-binding protein